MAHQEQFEFLQLCKTVFPDHFVGGNVLEVGSLNVNNSERGLAPRSLFVRSTYTGIDVGPGRGVDLVCAGQDYDAPDDVFDVVLSCEVMEHNPCWRETFANMARMCKPGGLVVMTCATLGRPEHGTPRSDPDSSPLTSRMDGGNYYRNLTGRDFLRARLTDGFARYGFWTNWLSCDLYFAGVKAPAGADYSLAFDGIGRHYRAHTLRSVKTMRRWLKASCLLAH